MTAVRTQIAFTLLYTVGRRYGSSDDSSSGELNYLRIELSGSDVACDIIWSVGLAVVSRDEQWRRQLWGTGARALPQLSTILFLVHFGVNLRANYPSIV